MISQRTKQYKRKYDGLSPYSVKILVGIVLMGAKIKTHPNKKRSYIFETKDGQILDQFLHSTAVNALVGKNCLGFSENKTAFFITDVGMIHAINRIRETGAEITAEDICETLKESGIGFIKTKQKSEEKNPIEPVKEYNQNVVDTAVMIG